MFKARSHRTAAFLAAASVSAISFLGTVSLAGGWTAASFSAVSLPDGANQDVFRNYDFTERTELYTKTDWAVTLFFRNNAEVDKIKVNAGTVGYPSDGDTMYGRMNDKPAYSLFWDPDGGRKKQCLNQSNVHVRLYANPATGDRNYSVTYGYYVIGTSHRDIKECGGPAEFGYSEAAEDDFVNDIDNVWPNVLRDYRNFGNKEVFRREGGTDQVHVWNNNEFASDIFVP